ncbi:MAG: Predicted hydroxymethylpyrimidine transporter CytX, partial [uncultured Rubrobacteraceae bacterium]
VAADRRAVGPRYGGARGGYGADDGVREHRHGLARGEHGRNDPSDRHVVRARHPVLAGGPDHPARHAARGGRPGARRLHRHAHGAADDGADAGLVRGAGRHLSGAPEPGRPHGVELGAGAARRHSRQLGRRVADGLLQRSALYGAVPEHRRAAGALRAPGHREGRAVYRGRHDRARPLRVLQRLQPVRARRVRRHPRGPLDRHDGGYSVRCGGRHGHLVDGPLGGLQPQRQDAARGDRRDRDRLHDLDGARHDPRRHGGRVRPARGRGRAGVRRGGAGGQLRDTGGHRRLPLRHGDQHARGLRHDHVLPEPQAPERLSRARAGHRSHLYSRRHLAGRLELLSGLLAAHRDVLRAGLRDHARRLLRAAARRVLRPGHPRQARRAVLVHGRVQPAGVGGVRGRGRAGIILDQDLPPLLRRDRARLRPDARPLPGVPRRRRPRDGTPVGDENRRGHGL